MPRELYDHKLNGLIDALTVEVLDQPGQGGACHHYRLSGFSTAGTVNDPFVARHLAPAEHMTILFQNGPIQEFGVNGVSNEAVLAVLIDRMRGFQSGQFACRENAIALTHMEEALMWLQKRTRDRLARGVEGTNQK